MENLQEHLLQIVLITGTISNLIIIISYLKLLKFLKGRKK